MHTVLNGVKTFFLGILNLPKPFKLGKNISQLSLFAKNEENYPKKSMAAGV